MAFGIFRKKCTAARAIIVSSRLFLAKKCYSDTDTNLVLAMRFQNSFYYYKVECTGTTIPTVNWSNC